MTKKFSFTLDNITLPQQLPPLVLIAFNRPDLLKIVTEGIKQQSLQPKQIIAFVDGYRQESDQPLIAECVTILEDLGKFAPIEIVIRESNLGCDRQILTSLTEVLATYPSLVYLEDDILPNPCFYDRMCRLLEAYRDCEEVFSLSAYANVPRGFDQIINTDFMVSNRVFCWGLATWANRWQKLDLINKPPQYNPFGKYYDIPANIQTKLTMVNQFWLEKNQQTDWNISFNLGVLDHQGVHIIPMKSFIKNIGFGHPQAKTYKSNEPDWVNSAYDAKSIPNTIPENLALPAPLQNYLTPMELGEYLQAKNLWLSLDDLISLWRKYPNWQLRLFLLSFFKANLGLLWSRWRRGGK